MENFSKKMTRYFHLVPSASSLHELVNTNLVELQVSKKNFDFSKHLQFSFMYAVRKMGKEIENVNLEANVCVRETPDSL